MLCLAVQVITCRGQEHIVFRTTGHRACFLCVCVQNAVIGEETGNKLKREVLNVLYVCQIVEYCLLAVGAVLLLCACVLIAVCIYQRQRRHQVTHLSVSLSVCLSVCLSLSLSLSLSPCVGVLFYFATYAVFHKK